VASSCRLVVAGGLWGGVPAEMRGAELLSCWSAAAPDGPWGLAGSQHQPEVVTSLDLGSWGCGKLIAHGSWGLPSRE